MIRSKRPRRRQLLVVTVLGVSAAAGWLLLERKGPSRWVRVVRGEIAPAITASGEIEAVDAELFGPPPIPGVWEFKVTWIAEEGAVVAAGEPLIRFDPTEVARQLEEERANEEQRRRQLDKRRAALELERLDLDLAVAEAEAERRKARLRTEVPESVVSRHEVEAARAELELEALRVAHQRSLRDATADRARAELAQLERLVELSSERVETLERAVGRMTVLAPRAGTVVLVSDRRQQKVQPGDTVWYAQRLVALPNLERLRGRIEVAESDAGALEIGQRVRLRLDAHPDREIRGRITRISETVERRSALDPAKVARVQVEFDEIDPDVLRPGMRFRAEVERYREGDVLLLPVTAVDLAAGEPRVVRQRWLGRETVAPRLGRRDARHVEVLSELEEGDRVLLPVEPAS